jgi:uncharacterized protein
MPKFKSPVEDNRLFLDTAFAQAWLNSRDQYHAKAVQLTQKVEQASRIWTTRMILIELADAFSALNRLGASTYVRFIATQPNKFRIVEVDDILYNRGLDLYESRPDKDWGLTDCISFIVMRENGLTDALTSDQHFVQAGFRALMRDD